LLEKHNLVLAKLYVYGGFSVLGHGRGVLGSMEQAGAAIATKASDFLGMGTYIAAWARKN
jgi:hypothetical protein